MASSGRGRISNTANRHSRGPIPLPVYQPLANKLNEAAQRALHNIPNTHRLDGLHRRLQNANAVLSNSAVEVNDRYQRKSFADQKRQAKLRAQGLEDDNQDDEAMENVRQDVHDMTDRIDESVRKVIDCKVAVEAVEAALKEVSANIAAGGGAVAPTQSTLGASQFRQQQQKRGLAVGDEDSEHDDEGSQSMGDGPSMLLRATIADHGARYEALSMKNRYV